MQNSELGIGWGKAESSPSIPIGSAYCIFVYGNFRKRFAVFCGIGGLYVRVAGISAFDGGKSTKNYKNDG